MPQSYDQTPDGEMRQRVRDQLLALREASGGNVAWDTEDPADHNYLFVPSRVLMTAEVADTFEDTLAATGLGITASRDEGRANITSGLISFTLTEFSGDTGRDVQMTVEAVARQLGTTDAVTPEYYVHVAGNGSGNACPATEPAETGLTAAWPPKVTDGDGDGVVVAVVDCGFVDPQPQQWADRWLAEYDGHGPFAADIIRTQAPNIDPIIPVQFETLNWTNNNASAGIISEADLAHGLEQALKSEPAPHIISMSAGTHTLNHQSPKSFEDLWNNTLAGMDTVLVAAAGNECTRNPFYPAAAWWATGVGSLDRKADRVSDFSNYGDSADVFLLGRNHVNQFPYGHYTCRWTPDADDERYFNTGWARWSGTSFSTPLLAGYLAAHVGKERLNNPGASVRDLCNQFLAGPTVRWAWHEGWDGYYRYISSQTY